MGARGNMPALVNQLRGPTVGGAQQQMPSTPVLGPMAAMGQGGGKFGQQMPRPQVAPTPNYGAMGPRGSYNAQMANFAQLQQQMAQQRAMRQAQMAQPGPAWANPPARPAAPAQADIDARIAAALQQQQQAQQQAQQMNYGHLGGEN